MFNISDKLAINLIKIKTIDAIRKSNSGHIGSILGITTTIYQLWKQTLTLNTKNTKWINRDRFILSNGHLSMLLYSILNIFELRNKKKTIINSNDIKKFRKINKKCKGHPEYSRKIGIECSTGLLGQGLATSVGVAIAEKWKQRFFNKKKNKIIDYKIYTIFGDGCMMEGLSSESASIAGHLRLNNLCWIYDKNNITSDGIINKSCSDKIIKKFKSYGFIIKNIKNSNNLYNIQEIYTNFFNKNYRMPILIIMNSRLGYGSSLNQDSDDTHSRPLKNNDFFLTKTFYKWTNKRFYIIKKIKIYIRKIINNRNLKKKKIWEKNLNNYKILYPKLWCQIKIMKKNIYITKLKKLLNIKKKTKKKISMLGESKKIMRIISKTFPWFLGGSADLKKSTKIYFKKNKLKINNISFGARESSMSAILNGLALSNLISFGSTFLIFSDYMKPSIRMTSIMNLFVIYVFTHDTFDIGEDGPTHQPIEQLKQLRLIPNLTTVRPCDIYELIECWKLILQIKKPIALILPKQKINKINREKYNKIKLSKKGG